MGGYIYRGNDFWDLEGTWDNNAFYTLKEDPNINSGSGEPPRGFSESLRGNTRPGPGEGIPDNAVALMIYMSEYHRNYDAIQHLQLNSQYYQDISNDTQLPVILKIPGKEWLLIYKPKYDPSGRYYH